MPVASDLRALLQEAVWYAEDGTDIRREGDEERSQKEKQVGEGNDVGGRGGGHCECEGKD